VESNGHTQQATAIWRQLLEGLIGLGPLVPLLMPLLLGIAFVVSEILLNLLSGSRAGLGFPIEWTIEVAWFVGGLLGACALVSVIFFAESTARSRIYAISVLIGLLAGLTVAVHWLSALAADATGRVLHPYGWRWSTLALMLTGPIIIGVVRIAWIVRLLLIPRK
jgi:hypothetical protein